MSSGLTAQIFRQDCMEFLAMLPDESVDLIITDPAYESLEKHRKVGTTTRLKDSKGSSNAWFTTFPNSEYPAFFEECYRVMKKNAHLYCFSDDETAYHMKPAGEAAGLKYWKQIVWGKLVNDGSKLATGMGYHYRAANERILFFEKGKRKLNDLSILDLLLFPRIRGGHPTEKPVDLIRVLVTNSSEPGEVVVDPFMGSGSTGVAALLDGRHFMGCDINPVSFGVANGRLAELLV